jgi:hypothetical protein
MSNPTINRWGLNLFWYSFWYNDKINFLNNQQDFLINKLIFLYLHYGILSIKSPFINSYWYKDLRINYSFLHYNFNLKYFRIVEYKNKIINEYKSYKIRNKIKNLYYSKIWIFRYQNWLLINFYCFQPLIKNKKFKFKFLKKKNLSFYLNKTIKNKNKIYRYKLFISSFFNKLLNQSLYFKF